MYATLESQCNFVLPKIFHSLCYFMRRKKVFFYVIYSVFFLSPQSHCPCIIFTYLVHYEPYLRSDGAWALFLKLDSLQLLFPYWQFSYIFDVYQPNSAQIFGTYMCTCRPRRVASNTNYLFIYIFSTFRQTSLGLNLQEKH